MEETKIKGLAASCGGVFIFLRNSACRMTRTWLDAAQRALRLSVRTTAFHVVKTGSTPVGRATLFQASDIVDLPAQSRGCGCLYSSFLLQTGYGEVGTVGRMPNMKLVNGVWYFRLTLPPDLVSQEVPSNWPLRLVELVNPKARKFKGEIHRSLGTLSKRKADVQAARLKGTFGELFESARRFFKGQPEPHGEGQAPALTEADTRMVLDFIRADILAQDEALRSRGYGLQFPNPLLIPTEPTQGELISDWRPGEGLTDDDVRFHRGLYENLLVAPERAATARGRVTEFTLGCARQAAKALGLSIEPGSDAEQALARRAAVAVSEALGNVGDRNAGVAVATPPVPLPEASNGPKLSEAFATWQVDKLREKGSRNRSPRSKEEATRAVRLWTEFHGDARIGAITPQGVRAFRAALCRIPVRRSKQEEALGMKELVALPLGAARPCLSPETINKTMALLGGIVGEGAKNEDGIEGGDWVEARSQAWTNPFSGKRLETAGTAQERAVFSTEDLGKLLRDPEIVHGAKGRGGRGITSRWMVLVVLFTGARREELGQLKASEVRKDDASGVWYLDIRQTEGRSLKTAASRRRTPIHPELVRCGFLDYAKAQQAFGPDAWLFPLLPSERPGKRTDAWGKWFGRKTKSLGLRSVEGLNEAGEALVFHSCRHTMMDALRRATEDPERRYAITGHAEGANRNVGQSYGKSFPLDDLADVVAKVKFKGLDLSHLYPAC